LAALSQKVERLAETAPLIDLKRRDAGTIEYEARRAFRDEHVDGWSRSRIATMTDFATVDAEPLYGRTSAASGRDNPDILLQKLSRDNISVEIGGYNGIENERSRRGWSDTGGHAVESGGPRGGRSPYKPGNAS
jgi:hypothetical protein